MRRTALLGPLLVCVLTLPGCAGFDDFFSNTMSSGKNPHLPMGDSLNMQRVQGRSVDATPIAPQTGNVWPRGVERMPTLQDIEGERGGAARPSGQRQSTAPSQPSMPDGTPLRTATTLAVSPPAAAAPAPPLQGALPLAAGTTRYQTVSTPMGTTVVVPNGNGTTTLMRADGSMETIPAAR